MSRSTILLTLLTASLPLSATSFALPTGRSFTVRVEGSNVGTIQARNRVIDEGKSCIYTLMWTLRSPPLDRTVRCDIRESKASNFFDCESNRQRWITSLIADIGSSRLGPLWGGSCSGFDEFGQQTRIRTLIGGEHPSSIEGIFIAESVGDVQSFRIN